MFSVTFLLILLTIICKFLISYIKAIRTGDPNENELTYWMFSYDFRSKNKEWFPEDKSLLKRKRNRNALIFILYINVFLNMFDIYIYTACNYVNIYIYIYIQIKSSSYYY